MLLDQERIKCYSQWHKRRNPEDEIEDEDLEDSEDLSDGDDNVEDLMRRA
jgi:hypothetical protein